MTTKDPYNKFAEIYDTVMESWFYKDYYFFLLKVFKKLKFKPKAILELACGTGNLTIFFHKNKYDIEGLDLSDGMLSVARKKGLKVHKGNMTNYRLNKKYDLILNVFDSINYLQKSTDIQNCFRTTYNHLNKNGYFIFDMNSDYKINKIVPKFETRYQKVGNTELIWQNKSKPNKWISEMILFHKSNGKYERFDETHIETAYKLNDVKNMLKRANFEIVGIYSDFKFSKIRPDTKRWFFVVKKN